MWRARYRRVSPAICESILEIEEPPAWWDAGHLTRAKRAGMSTETDRDMTGKEIAIRKIIADLKELRDGCLSSDARAGVDRAISLLWIEISEDQH